MDKDWRLKRSGGSKGFTLMEILFGVAAFALLLAVLHSIFFNALRLRERAEERLEDRFPKEQALRVLECDLRGLRVSGGALAPALTGVAEGDRTQYRDRLEFYSATGAAEENAPWPDLQKVRYFLAPPLSLDARNPSSPGQDLMRMTVRNLLSSTEEEAGQVQRLISGVQSLRFLYFDPEIQEWTGAWDSGVQTNRLPAAVRAEIRFVSAHRWRSRSEPVWEVCVPVMSQWIDTRETGEPAGEGGDAG